MNDTAFNRFTFRKGMALILSIGLLSSSLPPAEAKTFPNPPHPVFSTQALSAPGILFRHAGLLFYEMCKSQIWPALSLGGGSGFVVLLKPKQITSDVTVTVPTSPSPEILRQIHEDRAQRSGQIKSIQKTQNEGLLVALQNGDQLHVSKNGVFHQKSGSQWNFLAPSLENFMDSWNIWTAQLPKDPEFPDLTQFPLSRSRPAWEEQYLHTLFEIPAVQNLFQTVNIDGWQPLFYYGMYQPNALTAGSGRKQPSIWERLIGISVSNSASNSIEKPETVTQNKTPSTRAHLEKIAKPSLTRRTFTRILSSAWSAIRKYPGIPSPMKQTKPIFTETNTQAVAEIMDIALFRASGGKYYFSTRFHFPGEPRSVGINPGGSFSPEEFAISQELARAYTHFMSSRRLTDQQYAALSTRFETVFHAALQRAKTPKGILDFAEHGLRDPRHQQIIRRYHKYILEMTTQSPPDLQRIKHANEMLDCFFWDRRRLIAGFADHPDPKIRNRAQKSLRQLDDLWARLEKEAKAEFEKETQVTALVRVDPLDSLSHMISERLHDGGVTLEISWNAAGRPPIARLVSKAPASFELPRDLTPGQESALLESLRHPSWRVRDSQTQIHFEGPQNGIDLKRLIESKIYALPQKAPNSHFVLNRTDYSLSTFQRSLRKALEQYANSVSMGSATKLEQANRWRHDAQPLLDAHTPEEFISLVHAQSSPKTPISLTLIRHLAKKIGISEEQIVFVGPEQMWLTGLTGTIGEDSLGGRLLPIVTGPDTTSFVMLIANSLSASDAIVAIVHEGYLHGRQSLNAILTANDPLRLAIIEGYFIGIQDTFIDAWRQENSPLGAELQKIQPGDWWNPYPASVDLVNALQKIDANMVYSAVYHGNMDPLQEILGTHRVTELNAFLRSWLFEYPSLEGQGGVYTTSAQIAIQIARVAFLEEPWNATTATRLDELTRAFAEVCQAILGPKGRLHDQAMLPITEVIELARDHIRLGLSSETLYGHLIKIMKSTFTSNDDFDESTINTPELLGTEHRWHSSTLWFESGILAGVTAGFAFGGIVWGSAETLSFALWKIVQTLAVSIPTNTLILPWLHTLSSTRNYNARQAAEQVAPFCVFSALVAVSYFASTSTFLVIFGNLGAVLGGLPMGFFIGFSVSLYAHAWFIKRLKWAESRRSAIPEDAPVNPKAMNIVKGFFQTLRQQYLNPRRGWIQRTRTAA